MSTKKEKQEITVPTAEEVGPLTDRLVEIEREIKKLTAEKKGIEARLEAYALKQTEEHKPLKDESREGRKVTLSGARFRLPVVFSSDLLIGSFQEGSPKHKELLGIIAADVALDAKAAPGQELEQFSPDSILRKFFSPPTKWESRFEDGVKFRAAVSYWLKPAHAAKFVAACRQVDKFDIPKSKTTFDFKAAADSAEVTAES